MGNFIAFLGKLLASDMIFSIFLREFCVLTRKAPNTTIAEFANTLDPDEMAHYEPSHIGLQCLPSSL